MKTLWLLCSLPLVISCSKSPDAKELAQAVAQVQAQAQAKAQAEKEPVEVKGVLGSTVDFGDGLKELWYKVGEHDHEMVVIIDKPHRVICYGHIIPNNSGQPLPMSCTTMYDADAGK